MSPFTDFAIIQIYREYYTMFLWQKQYLTRSRRCWEGMNRCMQIRLSVMVYYPNPLFKISSWIRNQGKYILFHAKSKIRAEKMDESAIRKSVKISLWILNPDRYCYSLVQILNLIQNYECTSRHSSLPHAQLESKHVVISGYFSLLTSFEKLIGFNRDSGLSTKVKCTLCNFLLFK